MYERVSSSNKSLYIIEYLVAVLIVASYVSSRYISLIGAVIAFFYILFINDDQKSIAVILFLLPFSSVFKLTDGSTSLFMILRVACVLRLLTRRKLTNQFFIVLMLLTLYSTISMAFYNTTAIIRIINFVLWFLVGYSIVEFSKIDKTDILARSLSQGTILTGVIGMNLSFIPKLNDSIISASYLNEDTGIVVSRFSGLWDDPNGYTVFVVVSMFACLMAFNRKSMLTFEFLLYTVALSVLGLFTISKSCALLMVVFWTYLYLSKSQMKIIYKLIILVVGGIALSVLYPMMENTVNDLILRFNSIGKTTTLTSGRTDLWQLYLDNMNLRIWLFGNGINTVLPNGRAAHNTFIQVIYNIGIIGGLIWMSIFAILFRKTSITNYKEKRAIIPILALLVTMCFLDGMFLELFYILVPLMFAISFKGKSLNSN